METCRRKTVRRWALTLLFGLIRAIGLMTVYYCSGGEPITFTNPEDMAAQGLPELPIDQPYGGSAFFVSRSDARG